MKNMFVAIFVAASLLSVGAQYQSCGRGEKCEDGECCMLTGMRYGLPTCHPLTSAGESCRPNSQPQNYTLAPGPFQEALEYTGVYWAVCPCASGFACEAGTCA